MKFIVALLILLPVTKSASAQADQEVIINQATNEIVTTIRQLIRKGAKTGKTDTTAADKFFRKAIELANNHNQPYWAGTAFYEMGQMYFHHKNHNRSFGAYFNARDYFKKAGAEKEMAYTLFCLGREQYFRGNYKVASGHLNYAIRGAVKHKLPALESDALEYIAILYHLMPGTMYLTTGYLKKSLRIKQRLKDQRGILRMLEKLGDVYYQQKNFDTALQYQEKSVDLALNLKLYHDADLSRLSRAGSYIRLNKLREAKEELDYIISNTRDTGDLNIMIRYFVQKGNYNIAANEFETGNYNYNEALEVANRIGVPEMYGLLYQNMAEAYSYKGMYKEAYQHLQQYSSQMAGFYAENIPTIKELELILNSRLAKDEVAFLNAENKVKETIIINEKKIRNLLLAGVVGFLLLAATIFYFYRNQKKQNSIIRSQAAQMTTMMKEIHHRVKNNLQVISSLLDIHAHTVGNSQAEAALKESRNRVQSMGLVHQHLYGEENSNGIAIDDYINSLAQNLFETYKIKPQQVELITDIEKLSLDADTAIPVGLILNELVSNCLKYAFDQAETGIVQIVLQRKGSLLLLQVKDNGKGFPENMDTNEFSSFGMRMINAFSQKLKASIEISNDNGACVTIRIKRYTIIL